MSISSMGSLSTFDAATSRAIAVVTAAWRAVTWRHVVGVVLLCLIWTEVEMLSRVRDFVGTNALDFVRNALLRPHRGDFLSLLLTGLPAMFAVFIVNEMSRSQAPRWWPYILAVALSVILGTILYWFVTQHVLGWSTGYRKRGFNDDFYTIVFRHGRMRLLMWGLTAYVYLCWQFATQRLATLRAMQLNLVEAERQLLHARLAFTQASIEPRFLIDTLGRIEHLYEIDAPAADNLLNELVVYLRAAIPREQNSS